VVKIAEVLGVTPKWLTTGVEPKLATAANEAILVGKVGAGAIVTRFDEGVVLEGVDPPPGVDHVLAARIEGDSMFPFEDGWLVFYREEHRGVPESCIGKLCVVGLKDGTTLVKKLKRARKKAYSIWRVGTHRRGKMWRWNGPRA